MRPACSASGIELVVRNRAMGGNSITPSHFCAPMQLDEASLFLHPSLPLDLVFIVYVVDLYILSALYRPLIPTTLLFLGLSFLLSMVSPLLHHFFAHVHPRHVFLACLTTHFLDTRFPWFLQGGDLDLAVYEFAMIAARNDCRLEYFVRSLLLLPRR
jgi:hypothetical protein